MSKETLDLMLGLNRQELEIQIALQCAPLLTGRKISNLLTVDKRFRSAVLRLFRSSAVSCYVLYESDDRITFLLYVRKKLEAYLRTEKVKKLMEEFGCSGRVLSKILYRVSERYRAHMEGKGDFPHEIGLLLGYPPEDVIGFIENRGQNPLYIGYWKVYSNLEECRKVFAGYDQAREKVIHMVSSGMTVKNIMELYDLHSRKLMAV
ncbi:MAG: DUF3793 family protein [Clostridium sp.]